MKKENYSFASGFLLLLSFFFLINPATAIITRTGEFVSVVSGEIVNEDVILAGDFVNIDGTVKGDVFCAGNNINIRGTVEGYVICAGSDEIEVSGKVTNDMIILHGKSLYISGEVGDNLIFFGNNLETNQKSNVSGDLYSFALDNKLKGTLKGKIFKPKIISELKKEKEILSVTLMLFTFLSFLVIGAFLFLIIPKATENTSVLLRKEFFKSFLIGFLFVFLFPVLIIVLSATIIGIPLALILLTIYLMVILVFSKIVFSHSIGVKIFEIFKSGSGKEKDNKKGFIFNILSLFIGLLILDLLGFIWFNNLILCIASLIFGSGAITLYFYDLKRGKRGGKRKEVVATKKEKKQKEKKNN